MNKGVTLLLVTGAFIGSMLTEGCTQMPTEKQSVSDMRPQISFKADGNRAQSSRVIVDGLDMGVVSDFIDGKSAVRVLPGTHIVSVISDTGVLLTEKVYLGDGVSRSFIVK
ncbi:hypothetical protein CAP31_00710 [Sulfuriferula sp. AH1]|uniref:hypothetical protein n=1 Tax=Sulfuriferula sp. AH1 TaxID=1985873 RepID=UPI000B3B8C62|nr:hypothetical protein [Sulfuriferula sp. AH1]ARU30340.1 hypothetical protein CAP31_00710 [Sulfuriferula sp. AH1]